MYKQILIDAFPEISTEFPLDDRSFFFVMLHV